MAEQDVPSISNWSHFLHAHGAPGVRDPRDTFLDWLVDFGKRARVRHVLLPTCDDTAWLYAVHRDTVSRY